jgi:hypothetical protein
MVALAGTVWWLALPPTLHAQPAACTAAPQAPQRLSVKVDDAVPATATQPFTPAVFTISWKAPRVSPGTEPAAYLLEAGSTTNASDVASIQVSAAELTFVTPVANGRYFVRVRAVNGCGQSAPSNEARAQVKDSAAPGAPNPFVIIDSVQATRERVGTSAFVRVMGQVRNGWGAGPAALVTVTASYENKGAGVGVTQKTYASGTSRRLARSGIVTDTTLEPGATGCFIMFAAFQTSQITGLGLVATPSAVQTTPMTSAAEVTGGLEVKADDFETLQASATIRNGGRSPTMRNEVWVEVRDGDGRVLDCVSAPARVAGLLAPGQTASATLATEAQFSSARLLRSWVTWEEPQDASGTLGSDRYRELRAKLLALLGAGPDDAAPQDVAAARDALRAELERLETAGAGQ